jgi:hypothetical protein
MDFFSLSVGFLLGTLTGAAGQYIGEKYTDKRRRIESIADGNREWINLGKRFPDEISEFKADTNNPEFIAIREFFIKSSKTTVNRTEPYFEYHTDKLVNLEAAISQLERLGYIENITLGNCPHYRMTEDFIDRLRGG